MTIRTPIILAALMAIATPLSANTWSAENSAGGSGTATRDCVRGEVAINCTVEGTWTGRQGNVWQWSGESTSNDGTTQSTRTLTGPRGESRTIQRTIERTVERSRDR